MNKKDFGIISTRRYLYSTPIFVFSVQTIHDKNIKRQYYSVVTKRKVLKSCDRITKDQNLRLPCFGPKKNLIFCSRSY